MSLYELMLCHKVSGGCGHARHRHSRRVGETATQTRTGPCAATGCDGRCSCPKFRETPAEELKRNG
jgi:hypothetical protein